MRLYRLLGSNQRRISPNGLQIKVSKTCLTAIFALRKLLTPKCVLTVPNSAVGGVLKSGSQSRRLLVPIVDLGWSFHR